ncbi:MAG: coenzyme F420-0:L-glutamate ligase [Actinomycetales bacterium]|nr:coenzyme F420-0:L-glutamate ligase [Actinomycetales bacterium]
MSLRIWAPGGIGEVAPGDDLVALIARALGASGTTPVQEGDVVVVTSKIVSKAEGRVMAADSREAAIDAETVRLVAARGTLRIVENRQGLVMAAAGVDASNTPEGTVLLLPENPDDSARRLRAGLQDALGVSRLAVVVTDTAGRAWREGLVDIAIGAAGLDVLDDLRGGLDSHGRELNVTVTAVADEVAAASELVRGKTAGRPVAVVRGLSRHVTEGDGPGARALQRGPETDLFSLGTAEAYDQGRAEGR